MSGGPGRARAIALAAVVVATGCGESSGLPPGPTTTGIGGAGGGGGADGVPAGAVLPCPAGELEQDDGTCLAPGIPLEGCADGFVHDGEYGCEPVLPADACDAGQMAVPGDSVCRAVAECANGTWGSIPVDESTVFVDGSYAGVSTGSASQPFPSVQQAVSAAAPGAIVAIAAGTYAESVSVGQSVVLWGVCPSAVTIESPAGPAIDVAEGAASAVVRGLGCTGPAQGVVSRGAPDVLVDRVWIHGTGGIGVQALASGGASTVTVRESLIEGTGVRAADAQGVSLVVERSLLRGGAYGAGQGCGIGGSRGNDQPAELAVRGSVIEDSPGIGIVVTGSIVVVDGSVIRDVRPNGDDSSGIGILGQAAGDIFASLTVRQSVVERAHYAGICAHYADLVVERTVVRDVSEELSSLGVGTGIRLASFRPDLAQRPQGRIEQTLVERTRNAGVRAVGSDVDIRALVVRDVASRADDDASGRGISIEYGAGDSLQRSTGRIRGCRVERTHEVGIFVVSSDALIDSCAVVDTESRDKDGVSGAGVAFTPHVMAVEERPAGTVSRTVVERARGGGIGVVASEVSLVDVIVRDSLPQRFLDDFGDGILASSTLVVSPGYHPMQLDVTRATVAGSARAGIAAFAASVRVEDSWLDCNRIDLNGEQWADAPFSIDNAGGNVCGCGGDLRPCQVLSSGLKPPPGL